MAILDVKVKTKSGKIIDIEIQIFRVTAFRSRILFYMAQMIVQQINKGDPYSKIKPVISIIIADHSFISKEEEGSAIKLRRQQIPLQIIADSLGLTVEEVEHL